MTVKIPIGAEFNIGDIQAQLAKLRDQINAAGKSIADANRVKFNPVDKATLEDLRRIETAFRRLGQVNASFRQRVKATGQQNTGFFDLDWSKLYTDPRQAAAASRRGFEYVTGLGFDALPVPGRAPTPTLVTPKPVPAAPPRPPGGRGGGGGGGGSGGGGPGGGGPGGGGRGPGFTPGSIIWQGVRGGLGAAGGVGGALNSGLSAGASGGLGAGLTGFAGGLAGYAAGALVSAVRAQIGAAEQENIGYDTIKRMMGDTGVSFAMLKASLRNAADVIDTSFEEAQGLGQAFAELGNVARDQTKMLAKYVEVGGGFARAYGIAPQSAISFFGQARGVGITNSVDDTRRLGLIIGETIARSGAFAKAEEVLAAAGSFAVSQTRSGLAAANMPAWGGALAGMVRSGIPGLDVTGAAGILARANSSIAAGGAAGEAGQAFLYYALGRPLGLDPVQAQVLREQGLFGTGAGTFGPGSVAAQYYGGSANLGRAAGSSVTNLAQIMSRLRGQLGGNPSLMASAISRLTGLNVSQSMALAMMKPEQLGGLQEMLARNGVDIQQMNPTGIATLASIASASPSMLLQHAEALRARTGAQSLSPDERRDLDAAEASGDQGRFRDALIRIAASRDQEQTEGGKTRASINDLNKTIQKLADVLVEPLNTMRNALVYMAGGGKKSSREVQEDMQRVEENDVRDQNREPIERAEERVKKADSELKFLSTGRAARRLTMTPEQRTADDEAYRKAEEEKKAADAELAAARKKQEDALGDVRRRYAPRPAPGAAAGSSGNAGAAPAGGSDVWTRGAGGGLYPGMAAGLAETDRLLGLSPGTAAAQIEAESGFRRLGYNEAGARGIPQVQDATLAEIERRVGRKLDPNDPADAIIIQREYMKEGLREADKRGLTGEERERFALHYYHGGPDQRGWGPKTQRYAQWIINRRRAYGAPLPPGGGGGPAPLSSGRIQIDGTFVLNSPTGMPIAAPVNVTTSVGAPAPSGAR